MSPLMERPGRFAIGGILYETHQVNGLWEVHRVDWDPAGTRSWVTDRCTSATEAELVALQRMGYGGWTPQIMAKLWPILPGKAFPLPEWAETWDGQPAGGIRVVPVALPFQIVVDTIHKVGIYVNAVRENGEVPETYRVGP